MDKIEQYYSSILKPKEYERLNYGEVFTDQRLITKMINLLPSDFWKNKEINILDPAAGQGQFGYQLLKRIPKSKNKKNIKLDQIEINPENIKK